MPRADWNLVSNTEFAIPSLVDEQRKIAKTFDDLDHLITLHQREYATYSFDLPYDGALEKRLSARVPFLWCFYRLLTR